MRLKDTHLWNAQVDYTFKKKVYISNLSVFMILM